VLGGYPVPGAWQETRGSVRKRLSYYPDPIAQLVRAALRCDNSKKRAVGAWSPLGQGSVLDDPVIRSIAERTGKTPAQVVLRWHIQRGDIVFPKSVIRDRIRENTDIFDFELSATDVEDITVLDKNERTGPDPDKFDGR
jgi:2,5-diketo-D-gluconate reductase A